MSVNRYLDGEEVIITDGGTSTHNECDHCRGHVSSRFYQVFSTEEGNLYACQSCSSDAGIEETQRRRLNDPEYEPGADI